MAILSRYLSLVGIGLFFAVGLVWRAWLQYRRHGHTGLNIFRSANWRQHLRESLLLGLLMATIGQTVAFAASPQSLSGICFLAPPADGVWLAVGGLLLFGGTAFLVTAQLQMGASWRVGIDEGARPGLVTGGLYGVCRNPIYLGMFITFMGLVVLLPTWLSLLIFFGTIAGVRTQVLEEEKYLSMTYGEAFEIYASRVGRFVPGLGMLS